MRQRLIKLGKLRFLSTLSLRRATEIPYQRKINEKNFYPRSPCGERPATENGSTRFDTFLSTLSLRRATTHPVGIPVRIVEISIHALLAESDRSKTLSRQPRSRFLSTLSLRRATLRGSVSMPRYLNFYPRSPCGERPRAWPVWSPHPYFYPRSPCGERQLILQVRFTVWAFLSTLSLRRATKPKRLKSRRCVISIHALLAESDPSLAPAEKGSSDFYPRSPCGERQAANGLADAPPKFLSTLSLRRATTDAINGCNPDFISIHALLAESDSTALA